MNGRNRTSNANVAAHKTRRGIDMDRGTTGILAVGTEGYDVERYYRYNIDVY